MENKKISTGGIWVKPSQFGDEPYLSISIGKKGETPKRFYAKKNIYKKNETHPDYVIYESVPKTTQENLDQFQP